MEHPALRQRLAQLQEQNPALVEHAEEHARSVQNRIADEITAFAGSMLFVYIHIVWFGCWIGLGVERYPYGLLTMIVSLEAIFLSTFVMISQNRADAKREVVASLQWKPAQEEDRQNLELIELSNHILQLTKAIHTPTNAACSHKTLSALASGCERRTRRAETFGALRLPLGPPSIRPLRVSCRAPRSYALAS